MPLMKTLSPTEVKGMGGRDGKVYVHVFATVYATIRKDKSFAQVLSYLRNINGVRIVDYIEEHRRIVVRVPPRNYSYVAVLLSDTSETVSVEVKAVLKSKKCKTLVSTRRVPGLHLLSRSFNRSSFVLLCELDNYLAVIDADFKKCLLKLCRKPLIRYTLGVQEIPPSLCIYGLDEPVTRSLLEKLDKCIEQFLEILSSV